MSSTPKKLPGLNALRALAASLVLIGHVYEFPEWMGNKKAHDIARYANVGTDMVNLFFVISGFIITYILLIERNATGSISLKNFYIKRTLRIWPLYFFIMFIVWILHSYTPVYNGIIEGTLQNYDVHGFLFLLLFVVNVDRAFFNYPLSVLMHYWSLSVEEQFYIFWPLSLKRFNTIKFSVFIIIFWIILRNLFAFLYSHHYGEIYSKWNTFFYYTKFPSMAIGAIGAQLFINKSKWIDSVTSKKIQALLWVLFALSVIFNKFAYIPYIHFEAYAVLYLLLILNVAKDPNNKFTESKWMDTTGQISYGLYMYHVPLIPIVIYFLGKANLLELFSRFYFIPLVLVCYVLSWGISYISFNYLEKYFLRMKPHAKKSI